MSKIKFITKNQKHISAPFHPMMASNTIKAIISYDEEDFDNSVLDNSIPLEVNDNILNLIIQYCEYYYNNNSSEQDNTNFDNNFIKMDDKILFDLIIAANYLEINPLLELGCKTVADYIKSCSTPKDIRHRFGITNDFTPEEEEEIIKENAWCQEN